MRYLIRGKFTAQALRTIQEQGAVDRVERAKERFREMGAEIKQAYFVPTKGGLELIAIAEAEEDALAAILFAINGNGHIEEEAVRIMTPDEMDQVIKKSRSVSLPKDEGRCAKTNRFGPTVVLSAFVRKLSLEEVYVRRSCLKARS